MKSPRQRRRDSWLQLIAGAVLVVTVAAVVSGSLLLAVVALATGAVVSLELEK